MMMMTTTMMMSRMMRMVMIIKRRRRMSTNIRENIDFSFHGQRARIWRQPIRPCLIVKVLHGVVRRAEDVSSSLLLLTIFNCIYILYPKGNNDIVTNVHFAHPYLTEKMVKPKVLLQYWWSFPWDSNQTVHAQLLDCYIKYN